MKDFAAICQFMHMFHPAFALEDFETEVTSSTSPQPSSFTLSAVASLFFHSRSAQGSLFFLQRRIGSMVVATNSTPPDLLKTPQTWS